MSIIIYDGDDTAADWWPEPTDDPTPPAFPEWNRRRAEAGLRPGTFSEYLADIGPKENHEGD